MSDKLGAVESSAESGARIGSMRAKASSGALWVGLGQAAKTLGSILSAIFVARILTPNDYGVIAMAAPVFSFLLLFQDLGFYQSLIQRRDLDSRQVNGIFWITISVSVCIALVLVAISPLVSFFYHDARPAMVTAATAGIVIVTSVSLQHAALLAREMRFKTIGAIDCIYALTTLIATLAAAIAFKNFWAITVGGLVGAMAQTAALWVWCRWRPSQPSYSGSKELMRFGAGVTGFNLVNFLVRNLDNILIAKFVGGHALGLYDQSYKLMMAPMQAVSGPLSRVMMPILSRLQGEPARYRSAFLMALRLLLLALTPGLAVAAALSTEIVPLVLGEKWREAGPIFFWLSLTGLVQPVANATGWLFLSSGRTQSMFWWGVLSALVTAVGFLFGLRWGAAGVAAGLFWTALGRIPLLFPWCVAGTSLKVLDLYRLLVEPTLTVLAAFAFGNLLFDALPIMLNVVFSTLLSYIVCLGLNLCGSDGRRAVLGALDAISNVAAPVRRRLLRSS